MYTLAQDSLSLAFMQWLLVKTAMNGRSWLLAGRNHFSLECPWWVRRVVYLAMSECLRMVCTMGFVHTMLRDEESHFKLSSTQAYGG